MYLKEEGADVNTVGLHHNNNNYYNNGRREGEITKGVVYYSSSLFSPKTLDDPFQFVYWLFTIDLAFQSFRIVLLQPQWPNMTYRASLVSIMFYYVVSINKVG